MKNLNDSTPPIIPTKFQKEKKYPSGKLPEVVSYIGYVISGAKSSIFWISQLFRYMDSNVKKVKAEADSAQEEAKIARLIREDQVRVERAKRNLEVTQLSRKKIEELHRIIRDQMNFRKSLNDCDLDDARRRVLIKRYDYTIEELWSKILYVMKNTIPKN